jgi:RNA polymerase sigma-70 factor, ECF subfamily
MEVVDEREQMPVAEARGGDPAAWDAIFRRYQLPLYTYVCELVREEQASLDIVQETFVNAVRHLAGLRDDGRLGSWLFGIAHQKVVQLWRRRDRDAAGLEEFAAAQPDSVGEDPHEILVRAEQEAEFMEKVGRLPEPQRAVFLLHVLEDFGLEEIARITATPVGTVKSRLHYARRALRQALENLTP